jgi:hypothetical protein
MDDLFKGYLPEGEQPDIQIYIFPHLQEFLTIDLREGSPRPMLLNTEEVFSEDFFESVEKEFSLAVREDNEFPFAHLINLPLRLEEIIRGVAMNFILEKLNIDPDDDEHIPSIVVFVISGGALAMHSEKLIQSVKEFLNTFPSDPESVHWEEVLARLVREENQALQQINQQELTEALSADSPDYFTLWENRN